MRSPKTTIINSNSDQQYISDEVMFDFFTDFTEAHEHCTNLLIQMENDENNRRLSHQLFRSVHTISNNLASVNLEQISPLLQAVEDVVDLIHTDKIKYDSALSDVILLALDRARSMVKTAVNGDPIDDKSRLFKAACKAVTIIATKPADQRSEAVSNAIILLDPNTQLEAFDDPRHSNRLDETAALSASGSKGVSGSSKSPKKATSGSRNTKQQPSDVRRFDSSSYLKSVTSTLTKHRVSIDEDMQLFINLSLPMEERSYYWQGRTARLLDIGLTMNEAASSPVNSAQLAAAIITHDIGMAFLPLTLLHKQGPLTAKEIKTLRTHPKTGHDLIRKMGAWSEAAEIIVQHHERADGSGYPKGLLGLEIHDGAKILAIIDSFDARTHERAHTSKTRRPFVRAILEINKCSGGLFSQRWVDTFNEVIRSMPKYMQHKSD